MIGIDRWGPEYASFCRELCEKNAEAEGYEDVQLIKTTNGMLMSPGESKLMMLAGSTLLIGRK